MENPQGFGAKAKCLQHAGPPVGHRCAAEFFQHLACQIPFVKNDFHEPTAEFLVLHQFRILAHQIGIRARNAGFDIGQDIMKKWPGPDVVFDLPQLRIA